MRVEVISCMYNEEFLVPFFLNHYGWADRITVLLDMDTDDDTTAILMRDVRVNIIPFAFPDGMDDGMKSKLISDAYDQSGSDWVLIADADEFVFIGKSDIEKINSEYGIAMVRLYDVYRHITESDLDSSLPIKTQRQHGLLDLQYIKPSLARTGLGIAWGPGHHHVSGSDKTFSEYFEGVHWANADPCFCVERRIKGRRDRQSAVNKACGWSTQNWAITEESVLAECRSRENDPLIERIVNENL